MSVTFSVRVGDRWLGSDVNMANGNAMMVLSMLGREGEYCGRADDEFIARIDSALAAIEQHPSLDPGRETTESKGIGGCRVIYCGVEPGYLKQRLTQLRELAELAKRENGVLTWG